MTSEPPFAGRIAGIDFTSRPTRREPVTVALGHVDGRVVTLDRIDAHIDFDGFAAWLRTPGPWVAAFDFPFGLPRELVEALGWPTEWRALMARYGAADARRDPRPHSPPSARGVRSARSSPTAAATAPAGSSSPMKWVNPPVAYMLHAGSRC